MISLNINILSTVLDCNGGKRLFRRIGCYNSLLPKHTRTKYQKVSLETVLQIHSKFKRDFKMQHMKPEIASARFARSFLTTIPVRTQSEILADEGKIFSQHPSHQNHNIIKHYNFYFF